MIRLTTDAPLSLHRERSAVRADPAGASGVRRRRAVPGRPAADLPRIRRPHARLLDGLGAPPVDLLRLAGRDHPRRDHAQALAISRRPAASSPRTPPRSRKRRAPAAPGTIAIAGCATPISSSRRSTASAPRRRWRTSSPSRSASRRSRTRSCGRSTASCRPTRIEERIAPDLKGYRGDGPVRIGNAAVDQIQHDTYGSIILAAMPMFFDRRLPRPGDEALFQLLETLGEKAAELALEPDAGIWEYRGRQRIHTHSAAMCWAGCQRLAAIATRLGLDRSRQHTGTRSPSRSTRRCSSGAWNREARRLHRGVRLRRSRRQRAAAARTRRGRGRRSALRLAPSRRWSANLCARST